MARNDPHTIGLSPQVHADLTGDLRARVQRRERQVSSQGITTIITTIINEAIDDRVAALIQAGNGISKSYNDSLGTLTIEGDAWAVSKGDIFVATGSGTAVRLAVGTNGQVLVVDSTTTTGLRWGTITPPVATWSADNLVADYVLNCNSTSINELAMVLGTLVINFSAVPLSGFTITNETTTRTLDCNAVTIDGFADVLGTVIEDLTAPNVGNYTVTNLSANDRGFDTTATSLDEMADLLGTFINDMIALGVFT